MGIYSKIFGSHNADDGGMLAGFNPGYNLEQWRDAAKHYWRAGTFQANPFEEAFKANWHFTRAHPGALATKNIVADKWGIPIEENLSPIAMTAGSIFGQAYGPIGGAIGGGAAGWGLGSQFGDEDSYKQAYRAAGQGAAVGAASGYAKQSGNNWANNVPTSTGAPQSQSQGQVSYDGASPQNMQSMDQLMALLAYIRSMKAPNQVG